MLCFDSEKAINIICLSSLKMQPSAKARLGAHVVIPKPEGATYRHPVKAETDDASTDIVFQWNKSGSAI